MAYLVATVIVAGVTLAACDKADGPPPSNVASNAKLQANHELGRQIYNFRCYYCHGYSGDAQTLASAYLNPVPRNFRESLPADLPLERVIDAVANGRVGTAMKGFSGTLTADDIFNVASFIIEEFTRAKAHNTHYHTEANGWRDHERFRIAFPFVTGEVALDAPLDTLSSAQQQGRQLFMSTCISCHDRAKVTSAGSAWSIRPVTYPPDFYLLAESGRAKEHPGFDPHHAHEKPPAFGNLTRAERRGEQLYQKNCAFCHAADGTGRNWIGSFLEPNATDLTSVQFGAKHMTTLSAIIAQGVDGTAMPAWKHVFTRDEINAVAAYVARAFSKSGETRPQYP